MKVKPPKREYEYIGDTGVRYLTEEELDAWYRAINKAWRAKVPEKARLILESIEAQLGRRLLLGTRVVVTAGIVRRTLVKLRTVSS